ncbi:MAG: hypothetical protein HYV37_02750 [Candidatus Levyibacteriota bacterium]|nr:MAG: hypothetical protein HYV37_02750 [Candidatus Levybacteria bacterium]
MATDFSKILLTLLAKSEKIKPVILKKLIAKPLFLGFLLFFISLSVRTIWLDKIPIGIVQDNMIFVLNAKAVYYTGHDVSGKWNPFSFAPIPDEPAQAELPYTLLAPVIGPLPSSLFAAHIFYAVINSLLSVVLFLITLQLVGKSPAFIVGLLASFNPWNIFFGRAAFEASLAVFFYISSLYLLLKTSGWKKLYAIIPLAFGFYTYMAYKITFLPYFFIIAFYTWREIDHKRYIKQYITLLSFCFIIFFSFLISIKNQNTSARLGETRFISSSEIAAEVNMTRQLAIQNPATNFLINKITIAGKNILTKYFGAFSPNQLFFQNEYTLRFALFNHGYFYVADYIFFVIGFCYLFAHKRKLWLFLTSLLVISPLPSVVSTVGISYAMRSSLYIPFLILFIGIGIWHTITFTKNQKYLIVSTIIIIIIYAILVANFLYIYFFIQPVYMSEGANFSSRLIARYAAIAIEKNIPLTIISNSPKTPYKDFIFYSNNYNRQTAEYFRNAFLTHNYTYKNISFTDCKHTKQLENGRTYILNAGDDCDALKIPKKSLSIVQLSDSGSVYNIYQDAVCSQFALKRYASDFTLHDFNVESLSQKKFCETFIIDYSNQ